MHQIVNALLGQTETKRQCYALQYKWQIFAVNVSNREVQFKKSTKKSNFSDWLCIRDRKLKFPSAQASHYIHKTCGCEMED